MFHSCVKYFIIIIIMIQTNLRRVLSFLFGSLAFFYGLWQFRRAHSRTGLQNEKNGDEKVMKVNLFYGCGGLLFSLIRFFLLKYPVFYAAKLTHSRDQTFTMFCMCSCVVFPMAIHVTDSMTLHMARHLLRCGPVLLVCL